jgi:hypothetical protein
LQLLNNLSFSLVLRDPLLDVGDDQLADRTGGLVLAFNRMLLDGVVLVGKAVVVFSRIHFVRSAGAKTNLRAEGLWVFLVEDPSN